MSHIMLPINLYLDLLIKHVPVIKLASIHVQRDSNHPSRPEPVHQITLVYKLYTCMTNELCFCGVKSIAIDQDGNHI